MKFVRAKVKVELNNMMGQSMKVNDVCYVKEVWINHMERDIYVKITDGNEKEIITSIKKIEIISD
ncbi:hypothetical protein [Romboutsia timonensis]|uniref:hypothetical protein n=1 Tax=Romboutsia timonensis TaxID=1776391 RepID=UPI002A7F6738|nr:hypothetical protein [Romboutsia timonensis]MDY3960192.1 hypothetical protein [Romboutsia timonensis]